MHIFKMYDNKKRYCTNLLVPSSHFCTIYFYLLLFVFPHSMYAIFLFVCLLVFHLLGCVLTLMMAESYICYGCLYFIQDTKED